MSDLITIIIPLLNEAESLPELTTIINEICETHKIQYEVIFIDDGSTDNSWEVITNIINQNKKIRAIKFRRNYGKALALNEGFKCASGDIVITMDADLQDNPNEIPGLISFLKDNNLDIVSGWKKERFDNTFTKNIPSKLYNWVTRRLTKIQLHDFNCGLKAYRSKVIKNIELYGDMHRYIPVIAASNGFKKIGEKVVLHQARKYGKSKYGWERFVNGFLDLLTIKFLSTFGKRPMHFFGLIGTLFFFVGVSIFSYLLIEKYFFSVFEMTKRPIFYFAILSCIIGMQLFLAGFISELVVRSSPDKFINLVDEKNNC